MPSSPPAYACGQLQNVGIMLDSWRHRKFRKWTPRIAQPRPGKVQLAKADRLIPSHKRGLREISLQGSGRVRISHARQFHFLIGPCGEASLSTASLSIAPMESLPIPKLSSGPYRSPQMHLLACVKRLPNHISIIYCWYSYPRAPPNGRLYSIHHCFHGR
jgi:hypothetical protein